MKTSPSLAEATKSMVILLCHHYNNSSSTLDKCRLSTSRLHNLRPSQSTSCRQLPSTSTITTHYYYYSARKLIVVCLWGARKWNYIPGGSMAATSCTSASCTADMSLKSYQVKWSSHCRNSSIGGWAPYGSRAGIFRSSTNTTCMHDKFIIPVLNTAPVICRA